MHRVFRNLGECNWLYIHSQMDFTEIGNIQSIDNTKLNEKLMIDRGANNFNNGLWGACIGGHLEIAELMIQKGANNFDEAIKIVRGYSHQNIIDFIINYLA